MLNIRVMNARILGVSIILLLGIISTMGFYIGALAGDSDSSPSLSHEEPYIVGTPLESDIKFRAYYRDNRIEGLQPGKRFAFSFVVNSTMDEPGIFDLRVSKEGYVEEGYTEIPETAWVTFDSQSIELRSMGIKTIDVYIDIPGDEQWLAQRWQCWIDVMCGGEQVRCQILMDTSAEGDFGDGKVNWVLIGIGIGVLGIIGGVFFLSMIPGESKSEVEWGTGLDSKDWQG